MLSYVPRVLILRYVVDESCVVLSEKAVKKGGWCMVCTQSSVTKDLLSQKNATYHQLSSSCSEARGEGWAQQESHISAVDRCALLFQTLPAQR